MFDRVNSELLPIKGHYFWFNAATAPVVPFLPLYARQLGYSVNVVGWIYSILPVIGLIAKPLFGAIGDRYRRHKLIFMLAQVVTLIAFACILLIPTTPAHSEFHCHEGENTIKLCPPGVEEMDECLVDKIVGDRSNATFDCKMDCTKNDKWNSMCGNWKIDGPCDTPGDKVQIDIRMQRNHIEVQKDCVWFLFHNATVNGEPSTLFCPAERNNQTGFLYKMDCKIKCNDRFITEQIAGAPDAQAKETPEFWWLVVLMAASWAGMAVVTSIADAICFAVITDKQTTFGHQRVWGSVGWGVSSLATGFLIDYFSRGSEAKNYAVGFYVMAIFMLLDLLSSSKLKYKQVSESAFRWKELLQLFGSIRAVVFFLWCIASGLGCAMVWNFLLWHLEDLSASYGCDGSNTKTLQGLIMFVQCFFGEVPMFFLSGKLIKAIGHVNSMSLVLFAYGARFFLYSILTNPWFALPVELLNGVTIGVFFSTMATYANIIAPTGTEASLQASQGFVQAIFEGIGVSVGSLVGGHLMNTVKGSETFRIFSYGAFALCILHIVAQCLIKKYCKNGRHEYFSVERDIQMREAIVHTETYLDEHIADIHPPPRDEFNSSTKEDSDSYQSVVRT